MSYKEEERAKAIANRDKIFKDPGNGMFFGKEREFVVSAPAINLWEGVRTDAIDYFAHNEITWWKETDEGPTGHLLSSQVACINHLYYLRQRQDVATSVLKNIDPDIVEAVIVDDGFVEFEFIGEKQYLKERGFTRGANCTSVDAVMIGKKSNGQKKMFFIEWKYTETYASENKYISERAKVYDHLIVADDSPFISKLDVTGFYYEPFYQLMRQTLLANECVKHSDHGVSSYAHVHIVPEKNIELKNKITSPCLKGTDIHDAWKKVLKNAGLFIAISPDKFLKPAENIADTKSHLGYLKSRYWD